MVAGPVLTATPRTAADGIDLTWTPVAGASSYEMLRDGTTTTAPVVSPYTYSSSENGKYFSFQVRAKFADNSYSDWSNTVVSAVKIVPSHLAALDWSYPNELLIAGSSATGQGVWAFSLDGEDLVEVPIPSSGISGLSLAWSPDGNWLAVMSAAAPRLVLYYYDGSTFTKATISTTITNLLTAGPSVSGLAWSGDSQYLALIPFTSTAAASFYVLKITGTGASPTITRMTVPTFPAPYLRSIAWSGDQISVVNDASPRVRVGTFTVTGETTASITWATPAGALSGSSTLHTSFSPDGSYLAVQNSQSPYFVVWHRDGTTYTRLADPVSIPPSARAFTWSADSKTLFVASATNNPTLASVAVYNLEGEGSSAVLVRDETFIPITQVEDAPFSRYPNTLTMTTDALVAHSLNTPSMIAVASLADTTPPDMPTDLTALVQNRTVTLTWTGSGDSTNFRIKRDGQVLADDTASPYVDHNAPLGEHTYEIAAADEGGNWSAYTIAVSVTATQPGQKGTLFRASDDVDDEVAGLGRESDDPEDEFRGFDRE